MTTVERSRLTAENALAALICERVRLAAEIALTRQVERDPQPAIVRLAAVDAAMAGPDGATFRRLADMFRLSASERDVLLACVALHLNPALGALFRAVDGERGYVTEPLVAHLFGHAPGRVCSPSGALATWALVTEERVGPGEPAALAVDPVVPAWLTGALWIDRRLSGIVHKPRMHVRLPSWPIETLVAAIRRAIAQGTPIRIALSAEAGGGRAALAAATASEAGLPALIVETDDIADADWIDAVVRLHRLAAVSGTALIWTGAQAARSWPLLVAPAPVHFILVEPADDLRPLQSAITRRVEIPEPTIDERRQLWSQMPGAAQWPEIETLAARYRLGAGDIAAIAAEAPQSATEAALAARACRRRASEDVVRTMPCPFTWDDLILPDAIKSALAELAFEAADRERIWENATAGRLFPRESSLVALFSGASGTGKTMAAQVIATDLELDLLRVDLAAVMSKYIGETAKNLNKVFAAAKRRQAILLFDEADALFARRTEVKDAHDRYANADTNHLLQLIEVYRGPVILATNRRSDMDPAFVRRLRHVIDFPRPQPAERLKLWRQALDAVAPGRWPRLEGVAALSEAIELSGAQIKNAALSALFLARRDRAELGFAHVLRGAERELAKDGRPLPPKEKERWLRHA